MKSKIVKIFTVCTVLILALTLNVLPVFAALTFGSESVFNPTAVTDVSTTALDDSRFVVAYSNESERLAPGYAIIGTVFGDTITFDEDNAVVFDNLATDVSTTALDSSHFVVAYRNGGAVPISGSARVGTVSGGNVITFGSEYVFNPSSVTDVSATALDISHFVVAYSNESEMFAPGYAIIGTVSGDTITFDEDEMERFNDAQTHYVSAAALSSSKFAVVYQDNGNSDKCTGVIGSVSGGDSISFGVEEICKDNPVTYVSAAVLEGSPFVVAYSNGGAEPTGSAVIGEDAPAGGAVPEFSDYVLIITIIVAFALLVKYVPKVNSSLRGA